MTTRLTANLVLSCALGALAAGCTVHTYSARPEYPSTVFMSHGSSTRYEASFHTEPSRERTVYRPDDRRQTRDDVRERTSRQREVSVREEPRRSEATKPQASASAKPSRNKPSTEKPRTIETSEHVVLMPEEPAKPKPKPEKVQDQAGVLSFRERLEQYVDATNDEVAQKKRERSQRISRAINAAADAND